MPYLLDVNVLIALLDGNHVHHARAMRWFLSSAHLDWLSCPTTQNGAVRVMSGVGYGPTSFTPSSVVKRLQLLIDETTHRFIPDGISILENTRFLHSDLRSSKQVTDSYLLAISVANDAILVTMDRKLVTVAVRSGDRHLHQIP